MPDFSLPGVIFDVDGVLVASPHERAWRESLDALMHGPWSALVQLTSYRAGAFPPALYQSRVAGKPRYSGAAAVLEHFGVPDAAARAREYADAKQHRLEALIRSREFAPFDDAVALALALDAAGYALAAASSSKNANDLMRRIDVGRFVGHETSAPAGERTLFDLFAVNVCGRDVGRGKPDPDLFLLAAAELGIPAARCIVIEDAPAGIQAAKAAGMWAVGIARRQDHASLRAAGADTVVSRLDVQLLLPLLVKVGRTETAYCATPAAPADVAKQQGPPGDPTFTPTATPGWVLRETRYDRALESSIEARFAVSNGFLGVRASRAASRGAAWISWQHTLNWASWPRTFVAGLYDTPNAHPSVPALVPAPDWLRLRIMVDRSPLLLRSGELLGHWRTLDMRRGVLITEWHQRQSADLVVRLRTLRFVSLADRHLGLQVAEIVVDGPPAEVSVEALLEAGSTGLEIVSLQPERSVWRTGNGDKGLAMASSASLRLETEEQPYSARDQSSWKWCWRSQPGQVATLARMVTFARRDEAADDAGQRAGAALARGRELGWRGALAEHSAEWEKRWSASDMQIDGDEHAQEALRFATYHLIGAANPADDRVSIGARALTGDSYLGHVFWDTEIYLLPFYTLTWPEAARALLVYRHRTLPGARAKAARMGYRGALYAWESADTGEEVTPERIYDEHGRSIDVLCGKQEQHVSADIAYAVWQYWQATGDDAFLRGYGAEIILETARFWASRARLEEDGRYHIRGVIGPDEYHEHIDDNAFTNVMASWNIARGLDVVAYLSTESPSEMEELRQRLEIAPDELAQWSEVAGGVVTGYNAESGLFEQFAGYFDLEEIDLAAYAHRSEPMDVVLGRERTQRSRIVKQADVVALLALLPGTFGRDVEEANFRYYERRCGHGSSLSRGLHALVAARIGDLELAYRYFRETAAIDMADHLGASAGGVRIAALGGLWQAAAFGFAGLGFTAEGLTVDPRLPHHWRSLELRVQWRGRQIALRLAPGDVEVRLESGEPVPITIKGQRICVDTAAPKRVAT